MLTDTTLSIANAVVPFISDENEEYINHAHTTLGFKSIGVPTGTRNTKWTLQYVLGERRFFVSDTRGFSYSLGTHTDDRQVTQVCCAFDNGARLIWAYGYVNTQTNRHHISLRAFVKDSNVGLLDIDDVKLPVLGNDIARTLGASKVAPSVLLFYTKISLGMLCVRQSDDDYAAEKQLVSMRAEEQPIKAGLVNGQRFKVQTREAVGYTHYNALLDARGKLLLASDGKPIWSINISAT